MTDQRGSSLLAVLLLGTALTAVVLAASLALSDEPLAARTFRDRLVLDEAADAALALTAAALATETAWTDVPGGAWHARVIDGAPGLRVLVDGRSLDLQTETARRTCARDACTEWDVTTATLDRPFGARNPRWRLVLHAPMATVDPQAAQACACYLAVWVADDPADADDDPSRDAPSGVDGHGLLRLRAAAWSGAYGLGEVEALVRAPDARLVGWRRVP